MGFKIHTVDSIKQRTPSVLIYAVSGTGKTFFIFSVVLLDSINDKPLRGLLIDTEQKWIPPELIDILYARGLTIAEADTAEDLAELLSERRIADYNFIAVDGISAASEKKVMKASSENDTRTAYGQNRSAIIKLGLTTLRRLGVPVIITALEQWDRLFAGQGIQKKEGTRTVVTEEAPTHMKFMPEVPGALKQLLPALAADATGRMVLDGVPATRKLLFSPDQYRISKSNGLPDMNNPVMYELLSGLGYNVKAQMDKKAMLAEMSRWAKIVEATKE